MSGVKRFATFRIRLLAGARRAGLRFTVMLAALALQLPADAEGARNFPPKAQRGEITAHRYPYYTIDKKTKRLAVGGKIYNQQNMIVVPVSVSPQKLQVMYTVDNRGELSAIWLLTPAEAAKYKKPKSNAKQAGNS